MEWDLSTIWAGILAFAVLMYVIADGFDLGCGILFAVEHGRPDRDIMVNSIAPVWDGNETWLVMGGAGLLAVFPLAYSIILPALYPTVIGMLLALIFRGVAFEFRFRAHSERGRARWDFVFFAGSVMAALCQGFTLGGLLQGIRVADGAYAGGWWDWLTPFTILCGVAVVVGYALLGACWVVWRTVGALHDRARVQAWWLGAATLGMIAAVSLWTPFLARHPAHRPGSRSGGIAGAGVLPRPRTRPGLGAVPLCARLVCPELRGLGHQPVPAHRPARHHHLGRRRPAGEPGVPAGGCRRDDPRDPRL